MKTMCPPGDHRNGFVATHALWHNLTSCAQLHELPKSHCGDNREGTLFHNYYIYIYTIHIYIYIYDWKDMSFH